MTVYYTTKHMLDSYVLVNAVYLMYDQLIMYVAVVPASAHNFSDKQADVSIDLVMSVFY